LTDDFLIDHPLVLNGYIAGYKGYVELAKLAGQPPSVYGPYESEYNRLLQFRVTHLTTFPNSENSAAASYRGYYPTLITYYNFAYLTPELADYLRTNARSNDPNRDILAILQKYQELAPYWMMVHNGETQGEMTIQPYHQEHSLFQALARVAHASQSELIKYLDTPIVPVGDLYYIDNLVATLEAGSQNPTPIFADVPASHPYYREIETLYRAGFTAGCGTDPLRYCPDQTMNRAESAVFVVRGVHGTDFTPPQPTSARFADLPLDSWAAGWADALFADGYTAGCGTNPLVYCPWQGHTRAEGAVFYVRMLNGAAYQPPPAQGTFIDLPVSHWASRWAEAAYAAGLIPACGLDPLRFCPDGPLSRGLAAYMMVQAKGLE
jgi:hypothetical protein